jgi:hypothetical protein
LAAPIYLDPDIVVADSPATAIEGSRVKYDGVRASVA